MRILLMGDYSGVNDTDRAQHRSNPDQGKIYPIDVDNFETLMSKISPHLSLELAHNTESRIDLYFKELDDFHPDSLYKRVGIFQELRDLRKKLLKPDTFHKAVAVLQKDSNVPESEIRPEDSGESDAAMFERLLGQQPVSTGRQGLRAGETAAEHLIRAIVQPHIEPTLGLDRQQYIDSVDQAISHQMRYLLHHPEFQALESQWRDLHRLVSCLETGEELELYLLSVSFQELKKDILRAKDRLHEAALYRLLVEQHTDVPGEISWSAIIGNYTFGSSVEDLHMLPALGEIAAHAGGPFLASASNNLAGGSSRTLYTRADNLQPLDEEGERRWLAFRKSPFASWIGLAMPRILLRLPYGADTDEIDSFDFEEISLPPGDHEHFLWGSPACACAILLANGYLDYGDAMKPGDVLELDDLPGYVYQDDEGKQLLPCAETYLSERAGEALMERGLMTFHSIKNRNAVRMLQFRSVAYPPANLNGFWT